MNADRHTGRTPFLFAAAAFLASVALVCLSCGNLRNDLFGFADTSNRPYLGFSPDPASGPFTRPTRVTIWASARFSDWPIRYTTDPAATLETPELWKIYDPGKGIILASSANLRVVAFQPAAEGISDIAQADYVFDLPNVQVFVRADAPEGGDGTGPETPFNTLQEGIDLAASLYVTGGPLVVVCAYQGEYRENPVMKAGVLVRGSYYGDWQAPEFSGIENTALHPPSYLEGVAGNEVSAPTEEEIVPLHSLRFPAELTAPSGIEYFHVRAPSGGQHSAAALVESGQTSFFRCRIEGGNGSGAASGIWARRGGAIVDSCFVLGRRVNFPGDSVGIHSLSSIMDIRDSRIESGSGVWDLARAQRAVGVRAASATFGTDLRVARSEILGQGSDGTVYSAGIDASGGNAVVEDCPLVRSGDIVSDSSSTSVGLSITDASVRVSRNSIVGGRCDHWTDSAPVYASFGASISMVPAEGLIEIERNTISSSNCDDMSTALRLTSIMGSARVSGNNLLAGSGRSVIGLDVNPLWGMNRPIVVERNRIWGGNGIGLGNQLAGLRLNPVSLNAPIIVRNNIIHAGMGDGSGSLMCGISAYVVASGPECLTILSNTVWAGGSGLGTDIENGLYLDSSGPVMVDVIGNIIHSRQTALYFLSSSVQVRNLWHNCVYSDNDVFLNLGGLTYGSSAMTGIIGADEIFSNIAEYPKQFMSTGPYPEQRVDFLEYDFTLNGSVEADAINAIGYAGALPHVLYSGVSDGYDFNGDPRTLNLYWTPGAIERE